MSEIPRGTKKKFDNPLLNQPSGRVGFFGPGDSALPPSPKATAAAVPPEISLGPRDRWLGVLAPGQPEIRALQASAGMLSARHLSVPAPARRCQGRTELQLLNELAKMWS